MEFARKLNGKIVLNFKQRVSQQAKKFRLQISSCTLCNNACQQHPLICQYCQADLPYFNHQLVGYDLLTWPAIAQLIQTKHFDYLLAIAPYVWPFDSWISQLKYQHRTELAALLGYLLAEQWQQYLSNEQPNITPENTWIIAVPLHLKKWQERGFNQAHLIARTFAENFSYTYQTNIITRERLTENQVGKSGAARRKNLKNAFSINNETKLKLADHVILIDDVVTTGTTANEICKLLKKNGVKTITLASICLALPH